jgi:hypothetical protein
MATAVKTAIAMAMPGRSVYRFTRIRRYPRVA